MCARADGRLGGTLILKERYEQDLRLVSSLQGWVAFLAVAAVFAALPLFASKFVAYEVSRFMTYALVAIGLNFLVGFTGQVSLGHAGFFALGSYALGALTTLAGVPFLLALPAAGLLTALVGFLLGIPALRLSGPYLAIATLGFGLAVEKIAATIPALGGFNGLEVSRPVVLGLSFADDRAYYVVVLVFTALMVFAAFNLARSHVGRAFVAVRDAELAAQTSGVNLAAYKTLAFALSAFFTGVAGGLYAPLVGRIDPASFNIFLSILFLAMVLIGGIGTVAGAILGAGLIVVLQFFLSSQGTWSQVIYGAVLVLVMLFEPLGLYGRWLKIKIYWKGWPF